MTTAGSIVRQSGVAQVIKRGTGDYDVVLGGVGVNSCAAVATPGSDSQLVGIPAIGADVSVTTTGNLRIRTFNGSGTLVDSGFHVIAVC